MDLNTTRLGGYAKAKHLPFDGKASATPLASSTNSLSSNFGTKKVKINNIFSIRITLLSSVCNVAAKKKHQFHLL
jgi:hypothetical protein